MGVAPRSWGATFHFGVDRLVLVSEAVVVMNLTPITGWVSRLTTRVKTAEADIATLEATGSQPVVITSATTPVVVTAAQLTKHAILTNTKADGAVVFTLPAPTVGMQLTAIVGVAQGLSLDQPTGSIISGTATDGQILTADALGESIVLRCIVAGRWDILAKTGTWTAS